MRADDEGIDATAGGPPVRLVHVTTVPETLEFLRGQAGFLTGRGIQTHAIASPGAPLNAFAVRERVPVHGVVMRRAISPLRDLLGIWQLVRQLRRIRPAIVHAHTPKGGLLGMIAAWLTRAPVRIYHVHGLPFMTAGGAKRMLLRWSERVSCGLAHQVLCVSHSIREVAVAERLCPARKIEVLRGGSINGVDAVGRFNPSRYGSEGRSAERLRLRIPEDAFVVGFVGRVVRDKGIVELTQAWQLIRDEFPHLHLLVVGPFEPQDPVPPETTAVLRGDPRVRMTGPGDPALLMTAMDLVVLPTYREGFPVVPLEASAMALPVLATRVPGCIDAVQDGVTGTLVPARSGAALAAAIRQYVAQPELGRRLGSTGRARVLRDFAQQDIWEATHAVYARLLHAPGTHGNGQPAVTTPPPELSPTSDGR